MAKRTSNKDNLTKIKGVGPKIQGLLNAAGFMTYSDVAKAKKTALQKVLDEAGPRFRAHDPATWVAQAKELAKTSTASKPKPTSKPKAEKKPTPKPKSKPKPKAKPKSESKPKPKTKPKSETKSKEKPAPKAKPISKPKTSEAASKIKVGELDLPRFRKIMKELKGNVDDLTKMTVRKYRKQAKKDADRLLKDMRRDLRRWTRLLERGELTTMDFEFLVKSNVASAKMSALQQSGLAAIRLQAYRSSIFNMIIDTIFGIALRALA